MRACYRPAEMVQSSERLIMYITLAGKVCYFTPTKMMTGSRLSFLFLHCPFAFVLVITPAAKLQVSSVASHAIQTSGIGGIKLSLVIMSRP
jgi:hypothetical protein